jgi:hypothetical protein
MADLERPTVKVTVIRPLLSLVVGRSFLPGDEAVVSPAHARALVASGAAVVD